MQSLFNHIRELSMKGNTHCKEKTTGQSLIDYIGSNVRLDYVVEEHNQFRQHRIRLTNSGDEDVTTDAEWTIYFSHADGLRRTDKRRQPGAKLVVRHVDGWLHAIEPQIIDDGRQSSQVAIPAHGSVVIDTTANLKSPFYAFPRWYVVGGPDTEPRVLANTDTNNPLDFVQEIPDHYTAEDRYRTNQFDVTGSVASPGNQGDELPIIPTPLRVIKQSSSVVPIDDGWSVVYDGQLEYEASYMADKLQLSVASGPQPEVNTIHLRVDDLRQQFTDQQIQSLSASSMYDEAYIVRVLSTGSVSIVGHSAAGVFYGIQTILALLDVDSRTLPVVEVMDSPRFGYRGVQLDVSRNFIDVQTVLKIIDVLAMYKMNRLHLHLTDDQGWRLEIPGLPELTEIGARRGHDPGQIKSLHPYLGSSPFPGTPGDNGTGHYSVDDYRNILRYAATRHVVVIPEIDLPAHAHAAIQSMRVRRQRLTERGEPEEVSGRFALDDPDDVSSYLGICDQTDTVVNPGMESTYRFVEHVLVEIKKMHQDIQPLTVVHLGGDEVPKAALTGSPACQRLIESRPELRGRLRLYFVERVVGIASKLGLDVQLWEDGLTDEYKVPVSRSTWNCSEVYAQTWKNEAMVSSFTNEDYKVILSPSTHLYFDHPYEPSIKESGLFWATRSTDTRKVFSYRPVGIRCADSLLPDASETVCAQHDSFRFPRPENITGMEAALWTEMVRDSDMVEYMLLPRLIAVAERAWHVGDWETADDEAEHNEKMKRDWIRFATVIGRRELRRLEQLGLRYRLSPPGVRVEGDTVSVNTEFPGLPVEYSIDGGTSWNELTSSTLDGGRSHDIMFVTRSFDCSRKSRVIVIGQ